MLDFLHPAIKQFKHQALRMACRSPLYNWALSSSVPTDFIVEVPDLWDGDSGRGRWMCNDCLDLNGALFQSDNLLTDKNIPRAHEDYLHSFGWLRDLKALGGDMGRLKARQVITDWIHRHYGWEAYSWSAPLIGLRLAHWASLYPFFGASADEDFQEQFFDSYGRQYNHLAREGFDDLTALESLQALYGLIVASLALAGKEQKLNIAIQKLRLLLSKTILSDGSFISRSPKDLYMALRYVLNIRAAFKAADFPVPEAIEHALDRGIPALRFFRHGDGRMALFNDAQECSERQINALLKRAGTRGKTWNRMPDSGFERVAKGKSILIFDCGRTPKTAETGRSHAAPLAFEFSYGRDRIFTNCGTHPADIDWQFAMRATPAHNALTVDDRNAYEVKPHGLLGRVSARYPVMREEWGGATLIECQHDGYHAVNGLIHKRRIYMSDQGYDLRGEDNIIADVQSGKTHSYAIRFHLHPGTKLSPIKGGQEVLIKTKSGSGWRFFSSSNVLKIEPSIYMGSGAEPRKTEQIVIYGQTGQSPETLVKWAMQREG